MESKKKTLHLPHIHVGLRNLKTACAATLCALIYYLFLPDRNPAFACIGAIFGMGSDMESSKQGGGNRLFGTILGGFLGMGLYSLYLLFYPDGGHHLLLVLFLFLGVVVLILLAQWLWVGAIQPGGVVLCLLLFSIGPENYVVYCLDRILDTAIGVVVALTINFFFPRERLLRWWDKLKGLFKREKSN